MEAAFVPRIPSVSGCGRLYRKRRTIVRAQNKQRVVPFRTKRLLHRRHARVHGIHMGVEIRERVGRAGELREMPVRRLRLQRPVHGMERNFGEERLALTSRLAHERDRFLCEELGVVARLLARVFPVLPDVFRVVERTLPAVVTEVVVEAVVQRVVLSNHRAEVARGVDRLAVADRGYTQCLISSTCVPFADEAGRVARLLKMPGEHNALGQSSRLDVGVLVDAEPVLHLPGEYAAARGRAQVRRGECVGETRTLSGQSGNHWHGAA
jgi:hypothetical protein